jgi:large subunit ribosomal protein L30
MTKKALRIKYVKSCIGYPLRQKRTVWALGFKRLGEEIRVTDNEAVRGMLRKVSHLVEVVEP